MLQAAIAACTGASEPSIAGRWEGTVAFPGASMAMTVDVFGGAAPRATVSVPAERVLGKRLGNFRVEGASVAFDLPMQGGTAPFAGDVHGEELRGAIRTGDGAAEISLRRTGPVPRPPYREEEQTFAHGDVQLSGSLLVPLRAGRHPAVVLIHGSSTPHRDDFRYFADHFARRGVAAFIYDKRDTGPDPGGMSRVDLRDLAGDAVAAVTALQRRDDIDPDQVGLWGHSQGGWVAPIAAALTDVAFVVSFSGPGVTYADLDKFANANRLRAHGFDGKDVETALSALERVDEYVRDGGDAEALQTFLDQSHASRWAGFTTLPRRVPTPEDMRSWVRWRNLDLDPVDYWKRLRAPVLLLYGERDDVVPVQESLRRIQAALAEAGNADVTVRVFPGGDHGIRQVEELPELMVAWILARVETVPE